MSNIERLRKKAGNLTESSGVYLMKDKTGQIIYVGKAKSLKNRVSSYFRNAIQTKKVEKMVEAIEDFDVIVTTTEYEALVLECSLIKMHSPRYNILLKDDKGYHYIMVTDEEYPKIKAVNEKDKKGKTHIGPYTSSFVVKQAVEEANQVFMLPTCNKKIEDKKKYSRPCLNYYIKKCCGVCTKKISVKEYNKTVKEAVNYIKSGSQNSIEHMKDSMTRASLNLDFELALKLRERIKAIEKAAQSQKIFLKDKRDIDAISSVNYKEDISISVIKFKKGRLIDKEDYMFNNVTDVDTITEEFLARYYTKSEEIPRVIILHEVNFDIPLYEDYLKQKSGHKVEIKIPIKGEAKDILKMAYENATEQLAIKLQHSSKEIQALEELTKILKLEKTPQYIEAYDISNLGDKGIVGGMVVFENAVELRRNYRKFKIKDVDLRDDYASMKEMMRRRILRFMQKEQDDESFKRKPDLILVDGGLGHLNAINSILQEYDFKVPVFGMVKDNKHRTKAIASDGGEISISSNKSVFHFIQKIQDEVHRYTISYQRKVRNKSALLLKLTNIDGIGEKKATAIIRHFKTKANLKKASIEDLSKVAKVNKDKATEIIDYINY